MPAVTWPHWLRAERCWWARKESPSVKCSCTRQTNGSSVAVTSKDTHPASARVRSVCRGRWRATTAASCGSRHTSSPSRCTAITITPCRLGPASYPRPTVLHACGGPVRGSAPSARPQEPRSGPEPSYRVAERSRRSDAGGDLIDDVLQIHCAGARGGHYIAVADNLRIRIQAIFLTDLNTQVDRGLVGEIIRCAVLIGGVLDPDTALVHREVARVPGGVDFADVLVQGAFADAVVGTDPGVGVGERSVCGGQRPHDVVDDDAVHGCAPATTAVVGGVFPDGSHDSDSLP